MTSPTQRLNIRYFIKSHFPIIKKCLCKKAKSLQERYPNAFLKLFPYIPNLPMSYPSFEDLNYSELIKICSISIEEWDKEEQATIEEKEKRWKQHMEEAEQKREQARKEAAIRLKQQEEENRILAKKDEVYRSIQSACPKGFQFYMAHNPSASVDDVITNTRLIAEIEVKRRHISCSWVDALEPNVPYRSWKKSFHNKWHTYLHLNSHHLDDNSGLEPIFFSSFGHNLLLYCRDSELDYQYLPEVEEGSKYIKAILNNEITFIEGVYDSIIPYSSNSWQDRMVVFCGNQDSILYHFAYLIEEFKLTGVQYCYDTDEEAISHTSAEHITAIELISTKERAHDNIVRLRDLTNKRIKSVCYYSFILELSKDDVILLGESRTQDVQDIVKIIDGLFFELGFLYPSEEVKPVSKGDNYCDYLLSDVLRPINGFVKFIRVSGRAGDGTVAEVKLGKMVDGAQTFLWHGDIQAIADYTPTNEDNDIEESAVSGKIIYKDLLLRYFINEKGTFNEPTWVSAISREYQDLGNKHIVLDLTKNRIYYESIGEED